MKTIWKFPIDLAAVLKADAPIAIEMPVGTRIIHVAAQYNTVMVWGEVVPENPLEERLFYVVGTGWPVPDQTRYVGSALIEKDMIYVWHIYERTWGVDDDA